MTNKTYKFNLKNWLAWGIGELSDLEDLEDLSNIKSGMPNLDGIRAIVKRRMPKLSKYIYALTQDITILDKKIPTVFASKNGELTRSFKIIRSFDTDVSPTQFSMSVHNAIAGLLSVISQDDSKYIVVDSLSGVLETALIEATSLLTEHNCVKVIYFDEDLPAELIESNLGNNQPIVLLLIIEKGTEISFSSEANISNVKPCKEDFKQLVMFLNKQKETYHNINKRLRWNWKNNA